jgi:hypothetical protein
VDSLAAATVMLQAGVESILTFEPASALPMSKPETPKQAIPVDEPFEVWWPKYIRQVNESVTAAEQYLEVPTGTISSIQTDPDFIATVKTYAVIEPMLNDLISARPPTPILALAAAEPDEGFQAFVAGLSIGGRVGKVTLAKSLGLITEERARFIEGVASVRNRYAHNVKNMHRSFVDILAEVQRGNGKIVQQVTGIAVTLPAPEIAHILKPFMYHRLADYLSNALHTLRPPPLPSGNLWNGLFGILNQPDQSPQSTSSSAC